MAVPQSPPIPDYGGKILAWSRSIAAVAADQLPSVAQLLREGTLHLYCGSAEYGGTSRRYTGFVIYEYEGKTDFTLGGRHIKTGYVVILDTTDPNWLPPSNQGQVR